jgi:hypothetical protein
MIEDLIDELEEYLAKNRMHGEKALHQEVLPRLIQVLKGINEEIDDNPTFKEVRVDGVRYVTVLSAQYLLDCLKNEQLSEKTKESINLFSSLLLKDLYGDTIQEFGDVFKDAISILAQSEMISHEKE